LDVYIKLRKKGAQVLLAVCDAEILGKTLKQGRLQIHVRQDFYKGCLTSLDEAMDLVEQSTIVNLVGTLVVKRAIERGLVHPDAVLEVEGVLHAQIVRL
jgi:hypothetical protein